MSEILNYRKNLMHKRKVGKAKLTDWKYEKKVSAEQIEMVAGHPFEQCVDLLLPGLRSQYSELLDTLNGCETAVVKYEGGKFFEGVLDGITFLAGKYTIFLVNNCQEWYLNLFLDFSGLRSVLTGFDCYGMSGLPKHEMLARIISDHALNKPVYIGDTASDEIAAKNTICFVLKEVDIAIIICDLGESLIFKMTEYVKKT